MGLMDQLGINKIFGDVSMGGVLQGLGSFAKFIIIAVLVGGLVGVYYYKKNNEKAYNKKIHIFEEINNQLAPSYDDIATEINIPDSDIKVFYLKKSKIYLPRGVRQMGKNHYWYLIRKNKEWVNFTLPDFEELMKGKLIHDHEDMRFANSQLKKLIQRNYKKIKWWQEYRNEIAVVMLVAICGIVAFLLLGKVETILGQLSPLLDRQEALTELQEKVLGAIGNVCSGSGIRVTG